MPEARSFARVGWLRSYDDAGFLVGDSRIPTLLDKRQILEIHRAFRSDTFCPGDRALTGNNYRVYFPFRSNHTTRILTSDCASLSVHASKGVVAKNIRGVGASLRFLSSCTVFSIHNLTTCSWWRTLRADRPPDRVRAIRLLKSSWLSVRR